MTARCRWIRGCWIFLLCLPAAFAAPNEVPGDAQGQSQLDSPGSPHRPISHGRFTNVRIYAPQGAVKQVVLMLSGDTGWSAPMVQMAAALTEEGALVAGIDVPQLFAALARDNADCVFPDGDLENLSHYIQAYYRLPTYHTPLLVGHAAGATLAYAMLAQAPAGTFAGALLLNFCAQPQLQKHLCKTGDPRYLPRKQGPGVDLLPPARLPAPWIALHGELDRVCSAAAARTFLAPIDGTQFVLLPDVGHGYGTKADWLPQYKTAFATLTRQHTRSLPPPPADLSGLPIVEVPVKAPTEKPPGGKTTGEKTPGDTFAIILSGDGGWAGLDKEVAAALMQSGIPVVGLDSLRYFWSKRTPQGLAADLDRIVRYYCAHWHRQRVVLIGYSQGADVLPFAVARLPAQTQQAVALTALLGLGERAHFEFHLSNWVKRGQGGMPVAPEIAKLRDRKILCLYGADETDSLCPSLASMQVQAVRVPGGHHFNGDYRHLAESIMAAAGR